MKNIKNINDFMIKYKNKLEKRKYFLINDKYELEFREPSFIIELAKCYYDIGKFDEVVDLLNIELKNTYLDKDKKIDRLSKIEINKLKDSFKRSIINQEKIHSVKLGNELINRNKEEFFEILYNISLISMDINKFIKTYFCEKIFENDEIFNNRDIREQILKNILNYFVKSENNYINFNEKDSIEYFLNNRVDVLYNEIYNKNFDRIKEKYNIKVEKIVFKKEYKIEKMSECKIKLYEYLTGKKGK